MNLRKIPLAIFCLFTFIVSNGQFALSSQFRTRAEYRDGQGSPLPSGSNAAFFISQRTRLNAGFHSPRLKTNISIQDVRVWGQDVSTINRNTAEDMNGLMLHEAWAELLLTDTGISVKELSIKIGRQELVYDDQRLVGNLDWLQQARRHDAAVIKYQNRNWMLHLGGAFNQNREAQSGTLYANTPPANYPATTNGGLMYKSMEYLYASSKTDHHHTSFLFLADQFSRFVVETADNVPVKSFQPGTWGRFTSGVYYSGEFNRLIFSGSAYYQFGKNSIGEKVKGYLLTAAAFRRFGKFTAGAGIDYTSGGTGNNYSKAFDPLYGTPHKFWGAMDYFYAGSGFGKGGLVDYYARIKHSCSNKLTLTAELHRFESASAIPGSIDDKKLFGEEIDLHLSYSVTKEIGIETGYSHFFTTSLLTTSAVKNIPNARSGANWGYVMINIKPSFIFK